LATPAITFFALEFDRTTEDVEPTKNLTREALFAVLPFERDTDRHPPSAIVRIRRTNHEFDFALFLRLHRTPRDRGTSHDTLLFSRSLKCGCGNHATGRAATPSLSWSTTSTLRATSICLSTVPITAVDYADFWR
jgi:hypothetical protein